MFPWRSRLLCPPWPSYSELWNSSINRAMSSGLLVTALVALVLSAASADAAQFTIDPTTRVQLSARSSSALLTVQNDGPTPIRLQVTTHAWAQSPAGQMELASTDDVVVFPTLVTLQPGERRKLRVAVTAPPGDVERTYRVFLEELPPVAAPGSQGVAVQMLTRVGIPVFLQPAISASRPLLGRRRRRRTLKFHIDNAGTTHFVPDAIRVRGLSATGETVVDKSADGWYTRGRPPRVRPTVWRDRLRACVVQSSFKSASEKRPSNAVSTHRRALAIPERNNHDG